MTVWIFLNLVCAGVYLITKDYPFAIFHSLAILACIGYRLNEGVKVLESLELMAQDREKREMEDRRRLECRANLEN